MSKTVLIIGGGLSGLYLGFKLKKLGFQIKILEANDRIGGRIYTKISQQTKVELGATWLWRYNKQLLNLCKELEISLFEQNINGDALFEATSASQPQRFKLPPNQEISYRIVGGTFTIVNKLALSFSSEELHLHQKVVQIINQKKSVQVITEDAEFTADVVVSTIPPQLLVNTVKFIPKINHHLKNIANKTHTWMKDSIKFGLVYKTPFWKEKGLSGVGFSNVGPFTEIYDHTNFKNKTFALMGFLNNNLSKETKAYREEKISKQLFKFFGKEGKNYICYEEKVWHKEPLLSFNNQQFLSPHSNNGHPIYQKKYINNKLIIAGSETSPSYGGYMEGAIFRGNQVVAQLVSLQEMVS
ncbi:FAD-dependent oxidoreductase [Polaribacter batillariae]|uniref:FAD-dependent oxidoreductase n=1 Tax=Polaribacter batillariae TaxID=2808900 RepID=A0ABX7T006_9FLAO|nr:FAD-dependent oxidoreductase [Polaribacter batillariae]QTD38413.1 FAD-dependent oxidoreductase [Polaribacter batillariae]